MRAYLRSLLALCALLIAGAVAAQERQGWLGAGLDDVTREEADKLGWESPRGAKITDLAKGSPAAAAGLELGDVIATFDGIEVENSNALTAAVMAKGAGALTKLRVMRAGKERTVTVALGARPGGLLVGAEKAPQLTLDTGGHMAKVLELAITPDGKRLVSGSNDKTVRVWDIETGKAVRIIRGESAPGDWGALYAMALSPDGARVAVGGFLHANDRATSSAVRIHDLASGKVEMLLKGHSNVVGGLAFSPDGKRLVSGSSDKTAIIWDLAQRQQVVRLSGHGKAVKAVAFTNDGDRVVTGSEDQTLRLWRSSDGALIAEMTEHKLVAARCRRTRCSAQGKRRQEDRRLVCGCGVCRSLTDGALDCVWQRGRQGAVVGRPHRGLPATACFSRRVAGRGRDFFAELQRRRALGAFDQHGRRLPDKRRGHGPRDARGQVARQADNAVLHGPHPVQWRHGPCSRRPPGRGRLQQHHSSLGCADAESHQDARELGKDRASGGLRGRRPFHPLGRQTRHRAGRKISLQA